MRGLGLVCVERVLMIESMLAVLMSVIMVMSPYIASWKWNVSEVALGIYCWIYNL